MQAVLDGAHCTYDSCTMGTHAQPCLGNRVQKLFDYEQQNEGWFFVLPHHKSSKKWGNRAIRFRLPNELAEMLAVYEQEYRPVLVRGRPETLTLFVTATGLPFSGPTFTAYWKDLMTKSKVGTAFCPRRLRHVFVEERLSPGHAEGPSVAGAAMVMVSRCAWHTNHLLAHAMVM